MLLVPSVRRVSITVLTDKLFTSLKTVGRLSVGVRTLAAQHHCMDEMQEDHDNELIHPLLSSLALGVVVPAMEKQK